MNLPPLPLYTSLQCTDVANAVLDGADCVMLSGESAQGKYPVPSVQMMNKIVTHTEKFGKAHNSWAEMKPKLNGE